MTRRLVLCCDGTWNTPDQAMRGRPCPTNVTKLALEIADHDPAGDEQHVYYHRGVGTRRWERLRGGAFGMGLSRDVLDVYRFLVEYHQEGDELFFLGFSRGAFTARSTAGFVRSAGVLRPENADRIGEAFQLYRHRYEHPHGTEAELFRRTWSRETRIRFIGVWDTVGALGIPLTGLRWANVLNRRWQFHDTALSSIVDTACQALAVDERRSPFRPTLWTQKPAAALSQELEQVWFAGDHCDVGGGHVEGELADVALLWLADRARACGLAFRDDAFRPTPRPGDPDAFPVRPDPMGRLHDSRTGLYRLLPPFDRPIGEAPRGHEHIAPSVVARRDKDPNYAPAGLLRYLAAHPEEHRV